MEGHPGDLRSCHDLHSKEFIVGFPTHRQVSAMSHANDNDANRSHEEADKKVTGSKDTNKDTRAEAFMKQVKSKEVPSGLRPDLAPPGPDGEGGDGGGVGNSI